MRTIHKIDEPKTLTKHRLQKESNYDNYSDKDTLREHLVKEQLGVCCYCQSRIRPSAVNMKIEHWQCQENHSDKQLDYQNLLGACLGGHGHPLKEQHCDTRKGKKDLSYCPADPAHHIEQRVHYLGDGQVKSPEPEFDRQLREVLNLNAKHLVSNRKAVLKAFQQTLTAGKKLDPNKELPKWDGSRSGELPEYSQVVVYYLIKKRKRAAA